ncbi:glycoprotein ORF-R [Proboscivirus elephantidbeta4]|uniref:Glycoprotein ORF-R n=1 Tax=Elephant endotheliotropic herpesvirus 4 TaxID=548914 RepID=A0A0S1TRZ6_9BETA|nr:glycoprotein ORF-R [Elephant endotheliotropic herpesvirus 4]ALM26030.1 glycoprotein ORF-R [Elephant endotheliotropic herpesvirus 4]
MLLYPFNVNGSVFAVTFPLWCTQNHTTAPYKLSTNITRYKINEYSVTVFNNSKFENKTNCIHKNTSSITGSWDHLIKYTFLHKNFTGDNFVYIPPHESHVFDSSYYTLFVYTQNITALLHGLHLHLSAIPVLYDRYKPRYYETTIQHHISNDIDRPKPNVAHESVKQKDKTHQVTPHAHAKPVAAAKCPNNKCPQRRGRANRGHHGRSPPARKGTQSHPVPRRPIPGHQGSQSLPRRPSQSFHKPSMPMRPPIPAKPHYGHNSPFSLLQMTQRGSNTLLDLSRYHQGSSPGGYGKKRRRRSTMPYERRVFIKDFIFDHVSNASSQELQKASKMFYNISSQRLELRWPAFFRYNASKTLYEGIVTQIY